MSKSLPKDSESHIIDAAGLAYVPGDTVLWPGLSGGECIDLLGRFSGRQDRQRRDELIEAFELDPTKRARSYSKGNRQKVALIAALATRARLRLLDEPTSGLDPVMEAVFVEEVRRARAEGATVLLSSHILDEVEALCDRVTIIRNGRVALAAVAAAAPSQVVVRPPSLDELFLEHYSADALDTEAVAS